MSLVSEVIPRAGGKKHFELFSRTAKNLAIEAVKCTKNANSIEKNRASVRLQNLQKIKQARERARMKANGTSETGGGSREANFMSFPKLKISHFNLKGYTSENKYIRDEIFLKSGSHIISVCETWFRKKEDKIVVPGYEYLNHPRKEFHINATRGSGGVGFLISHEIFSRFFVTTIDEEKEDIFGLRLKCKMTDKICIIYSAYIPPADSPKGNEVENMLNHLLCKSYLYWETDLFLICGDFNGRIGEKQETLTFLDDIRDRTPIDITTTPHGKALLSYLEDSASCVINGRFDREKDNFTFILTTGKSVVDYFIVPQDQLCKCEDFYVETARELISRYNLEEKLESKTHIPDHSVISAIFKWEENENQGVTPDHSDHSNPNSPNEKFVYKSRKFKRNLPQHFLKSAKCNESITKLIDLYLAKIENQTEIDNLYSKFCNIYYDELKNHNLEVKEGKTRRDRSKPWWDDELAEAWEKVKLIDKQLKKFTSTREKRKKT